MVTDEVLLVSLPGFGIIDSGCSRTLVGQQTLNDFMRLYQEKEMDIPESKPQQNQFRFGNGQEELSERVVSMPVRLEREDASRRQSSRAALHCSFQGTLSRASMPSWILLQRPCHCREVLLVHSKSMPLASSF